MRKFFALLLTVMLSCVAVFAQSEHTLLSPDGKLKIQLSQGQSNSLSYLFSVSGKKLINSSPLGFEGLIPDKLTDIHTIKVDTVWRPIWGKRAVVKDRYNQMSVNAGAFILTFRLYDDGFAFRYTAIDELHDEDGGYHFAGNYTAWFYNGEKHNLGPLSLLDCKGKYRPVMTIRASDKHFMAIHEAVLNGGQPLVLQSNLGSTFFSIDKGIDTLSAGQHSAWRVVLYGSTPGALVDSHLIELLNPDPAPEYDFSWVRPGVALWDWRIDGAEVDGFTYSMSLPSWIRMVDFAAEQGFKHLVLDANWYGPEHESQSDPINGDKASDVQTIIKYAKGKGVGVWLYLNDVAGRKYSLEETLSQYSRWGATGVKYGFMNGSPKAKIAWTDRITRLCADNKLLINFHDGPVHPSGQMRTWPNAVTREYCQAQLDAHSVFEPRTFVTSVFVNMIAGPLDMNNGMFDLRQGKTTRVDENKPVPSTVVAEAARTLITFSGATILPDAPEFYRRHPELLSFLSAQQMPWVESRTLDGSIGEYIVMMRQSGDTYLVGAASNEESRDITIPMNFLPRGTFEALVIQDGPGAHYLTSRETTQCKKITVRSASKVKVHLAAGGGACLLIRAKSK